MLQPKNFLVCKLQVADYAIFFAGAPQNEDPLRRLQLHASSIRNIFKKVLFEKLLGKYLGHFCKNCS